MEAGEDDGLDMVDRLSDARILRREGGYSKMT